ncbi:MAG TPA: hypothetical protein VD835_17660 [Pyrinomonadaceae bacterium]|nr:hypothetical protein [Pyrinomonadaceae bacterium]
MRRTYMLLVTLAALTLFGGCTSERPNSPAGVTNANAAGVGNNNSAGSREGIGPRDTGIGGTSEGNTNAAVKGNSNVEPTGVNKNAGQGAEGANANRP